MAEQTIKQYTYYFITHVKMIFFYLLKYVLIWFSHIGEIIEQTNRQTNFYSSDTKIDTIFSMVRPFRFDY